MFKFFISLFILLTLSNISYAQSNFEMEKFGQLPILHEGRLKPLDSFARYEILRFAKRERPNDSDPLIWLATAIFDPVQSVTEKIFLIDDEFTRHKLGLEERRRPFYSYSELSAGLDKTSAEVMAIISDKDAKPNKSDKKLLELHENALQYKQILRSFSSVLPLNINVPDKWREKAGLTKNEPVTFVALQKINADIEEEIRNIIKRKGENPEKYSSQEQELVSLGLQIRTLAEASENNTLFRVIPTTRSGDFASPWELINDGKGSPMASHHIRKWVGLANAWQSENNEAWDYAISVLSDQFFYNPPENFDGGRMILEVIYNQIAPFQISIFIFAASFILSCIFFANRANLAYRLSVVTLIAAIVIQALGIIFRIYVLERPPVGTLYESILFVALISSLLSIIVERHLKNGIGILSGALSGTMLGLLALSMAGEGDNMKMLGAVLNTRFWLTTHVLCITIGYGWCLLTSVLAHLALINKAFGKTISTEDQLIKTITTHSLFSLLFTIIGTILGGIWADQSWGRFWGWDPKENGALLIVLWLIWLIHGKIAGQISQLIWIAGMAFLSVIVAIAWVGVNLLGVGLHSYGFIEGVFWGLAIFALIEFILISGLLMMIYRNKERNNAA